MSQSYCSQGKKPTQLHSSGCKIVIQLSFFAEGTKNARDIFCQRRSHVKCIVYTSHGVHDTQTAAQAGGMTLEELERCFYQAVVDDYQQAWDELRPLIPSPIFSSRYRFCLCPKEWIACMASCAGIDFCGDDVRRGSRLAVVERCRYRTLFKASIQKRVLRTTAYLCHFAEDDPFKPAESAAEMGQELQAAGRPVTVYTYPGTKHWFFEENRPEYNAEAAHVAWERTIAFLHQWLD